MQYRNCGSAAVLAPFADRDGPADQAERRAGFFSRDVKERTDYITTEENSHRK